MHHLGVHDEACSSSNILIINLINFQSTNLCINMYSISFNGGMNNYNLALNGCRLALTLFQHLS